MRVRDWQDILDDVTDANADPDGWRAIAGQRRGGVGEDLYLGHPGIGVYHLKTYAKNPYDVRGVGAKVARRIDDDIDPHLPDEELRRRFAVQSPPADEDEAESKARRLEEIVKVHAEAPTTPDDMFRDVMDALDSPAYGPMEYELSERPDDLDALSETFDEAEELLTAELDDLVERDEVDRGFY
jgi:AcrR family transcriptional regulator